MSELHLQLIAHTFRAGLDPLPVSSRFSLFLKKMLSLTSKHRAGSENSELLFRSHFQSALCLCWHTESLLRAGTPGEFAELCVQNVQNVTHSVSITPTSMNYDSCRPACTRLRVLKVSTIDLPVCY